jgi:hypothetical protein
MKRLPLVAIGVALCALATAAEAGSERLRLGAYDGVRPLADGDGDHVGSQAGRRSARVKRRRAAARRPGLRQAARSGRRGRTVGGRPAKARGLVAFARGAGTSRTCLSPAARGLLARIEAQFGRVGIVSTCRPGAVIASTGRPSRHASGNAIDFKPPAGKKAEVVRWLIANHRSGGVMTYASMSHIHVDIGYHFVSLDAGRRSRLALKRGE